MHTKEQWEKKKAFWQSVRDGRLEKQTPPEGEQGREILSPFLGIKIVNFGAGDRACEVYRAIADLLPATKRALLGSTHGDGWTNIKLTGKPLTPNDAIAFLRLARYETMKEAAARHRREAEKLGPFNGIEFVAFGEGADTFCLTSALGEFLSPACRERFGAKTAYGRTNVRLTGKPITKADAAAFERWAKYELMDKTIFDEAAK